MILYDPINQSKTPITYEKIIGITGKTKSTLATLKSRRQRIENLNCYLLNDVENIKVYQELVNNVKIEETEVWKKIQGTKDYYVSNLGRIKHKERILIKYKRGKEKKHHVSLRINNKTMRVFVHKIVAKEFLELENCIIYHKDGNILNNRANNLGEIDKKTLGEISGRLNIGIPVLKLDKDTGEVLDTYESITVAARENFGTISCIARCIKGELKTSAGYKWKIDTDFN